LIRTEAGKLSGGLFGVLFCLHFSQSMGLCLRRGPLSFLCRFAFGISLFLSGQAGRKFMRRMLFVSARAEKSGQQNDNGNERDNGASFHSGNDRRAGRLFKSNSAIRSLGEKVASSG